MDDKLTIRIRALLAKTVDRGCTEAEALAAAAMAKKLMDEHQVSINDLDDTEGYVSGAADYAKGEYRFNVQHHLAGSVAYYAEVKCWRARGSRRIQIQFFGLRSDVELAAWLLKALETFVWQKADEYSLRTGHADYFSKRDFAIGCVNRISERLTLEAYTRRQRNDIKVSDGRSLIAVKEAMVEREFDKLGLDLRPGGSFAKTYRPGNDANAISEGRAAGDKATFGRPVSGTQEWLLPKPASGQPRNEGR